MLLCVNCKSPVSAHTEPCPVCNYEAQQKLGFSLLSLDTEDEHFPAESFSMLYEMETKHFWFRARNEILLWAFEKYGKTEGKFFEIGCGTAYVLNRIQQEFPQLHCSGSDLHVESLPFARKRLPAADLFQMNALNIPFKEEFDTIGMFDVLEHIEEDVEVLEQTCNALKPGGVLMVAVPQHPFLWNVTDTLSFHKRRYTRKELKQKVNDTGMDVLYAGSYMSLLLPVLILGRIASFFISRVTKSEDIKVVETGNYIPSPLNGVLYWIMHLEAILIRLGVNFPMGGSLLVVAQVRESDD